ncbi:DUF2637 domain-containing protein [Streptomyces sp. NPDC093094]|uniref:DUF2637 domain-containing protein n=1 Tax=Streptomyces sp. NPDC093094 TaxID=3366026 RepID=UPI003825E568
METPLRLTRTHRVLIGVIVLGAVIIAGIGFAGSYAAVRELALKKGFGDFSYVFPIGIDAGICVLLALDLLLTWIRIPFPLLRQTAWVLTAATIAFNGAAAWPDPLGTAMHAVIPVLFVIAVEAARHAIGRIADITHGKHMEGVRLTRWLLSPLPTFLLWRRMKLWELRSYDQVIKLEQERLVYQARLHARFGRSWRRKAPVESLMPLRLARYGVPLAETAPAGLAAAGIEPTLSPPVTPLHRPTETRTCPGPAAGEERKHPPNDAIPDPNQRRPDRAPKRVPGFQNYTDTHATPDSPAARLRQHNHREPPAKDQVIASPTPSEKPLPQRAGRAPMDRRAHTAEQIHHPEVTSADDAAPEPDTTAAQLPLTTVDRYYLAWNEHQTEHGQEPTAEQLSAILADQGLHSRVGGKPLRPSTLRRYLLPFRTYSLWAEQRRGTQSPSPETIAQQCAARGITAQHNRPIDTSYITEHTPDFERRWQTLNHHHAQNEPFRVR